VGVGVESVLESTCLKKAVPYLLRRRMRGGHSLKSLVAHGGLGGDRMRERCNEGHDVGRETKGYRRKKLSDSGHKLYYVPTNPYHIEKEKITEQL